MALTFKQKRALYDGGLIILCLGLLVMVIWREAFPPGLHTGLVIVALIGIGIVNTLREAHKEAQLDEMQLAAASFGARWAVTIPITMMLLLNFFPPIRDTAIAFLEVLAGPSDSPFPPLLRVFVMGMVLAVILQLAGKSLIAAIWTWRKR